ncbi:MAG: molybdopterin-dependent oxidoreductase, partial [Lentisphaeria bacterium]|nr:molybdopterin-dependent oxidoreductase [Lentisphaeria bacterium]
KVVSGTDMGQGFRTAMVQIAAEALNMDMANIDIVIGDTDITIPAGESVGYNRMFIAGKPVRTAVITAGYADGVPLALTNKGRVLIRGKSCPVIGRVSMDYTVVDVTHLETVSAGDEAVLLGRQGDNAVTVEEWGLNKNTHGHDIWCAIGNRVKREYIW